MADMKAKVEIALGADTSGAEKATTALAKTEAQATATADSVSGVQADLERLVAALSGVAAQISEAMQGLSGSTAEAGGVVEQVASATQTLGAAVREAARGEVDASQATQKSVKERERAQKALAAQARATQESIRRERELAKSEQESANATRRKREERERLVKGTRELQRIEREYALSLSRTERRSVLGGVMQAQRGRLGFSDALSIATDASRAQFDQAAKIAQAVAPLRDLSRGIVGAMGRSISASASVENLLGNASALSGASTSALSAEVRAASRGSIASERDLAAGAVEFGRRGIRADRRSLRASVDLAAIQGFQVADAGRMVSAASAAMGEDPNRVARLLSVSSSADALADVLTSSGARARAARMSSTDMWAMAETLGRSGYEGQRGGAAIGSIASALTDRGRWGAMAALGVMPDDQRSMLERLQSMRSATSGMDETTQDFFLRQAFGEQSAAVKALIANLDLLERKTREASDPRALEAAVDARMKTTGGAERSFAQLTAAWENFKKALVSDSSLKVLGLIADGLRNLLEAATWALEKIPLLPEAVGLAAGGIAALSAAIVGLASAAGAALTIQGTIKTIEVLMALLGVQGGLGTALAGFKTSVTALAAPIAAVAIPAALATVAITGLVKTFDMFKSVLLAFDGWLTTLAASAGEKIQSLLGIDLSDRVADLRKDARDSYARSDALWAQAESEGRTGLDGLLKNLNPFSWGGGEEQRAPTGSPSGTPAADQMQIKIEVADDRTRTTIERPGLPPVQLNANQGLVAAGAT